MNNYEKLSIVLQKNLKKKVSEIETQEVVISEQKKSEINTIEKRIEHLKAETKSAGSIDSVNEDIEKIFDQEILDISQEIDEL